MLTNNLLLHCKFHYIPKNYDDFDQYLLSPEAVVLRCKNGVLKNFVKSFGNQLCRSFLLKKVADLRHATLLKKGLRHKCFQGILLNF